MLFIISVLQWCANLNLYEAVGSVALQHRDLSIGLKYSSAVLDSPTISQFL